MKKGMSIASVLIMRNLTLILVSFIALKGKNPFSIFPCEKRSILTMFARTATGQVNFTLHNLALTMLPFGVLTIIHKTQPFWGSIMGYFLLKESVLPIEIVGMVICFIAFIALTLSGEQEA